MTVRAFGERTTNAQLMLDCHRLGYIREEDAVLDPTYGLGRFWKDWKPPYLIGTDIDEKRTMPGLTPMDFTRLRCGDQAFDVVVFDPPYKLNGTPNKGGPANSDDDYGVGESANWKARMSLCRRGLRECARVANRMLLVKCQDQVCSGKIRWQTFEFTRVAEACGFELIDMLMVQGWRPQPAGRTQRHAARDYSTLLVLQRRSGPPVHQADFVTDEMGADEEARRG